MSMKLDPARNRAAETVYDIVAAVCFLALVIFALVVIWALIVLAWAVAG